MRMPIYSEFPVRVPADLTAVEKRVRELQFSATGVQCQALQTIEYQVWRHEVLKQLQKEANTGAEVAELGVGSLVPRTPMLKAYLQGLLIVYADNKCIMSQTFPKIIPTVVLEDRNCSSIRKRKAWSLETISEGLDI